MAHPLAKMIRLVERGGPGLCCDAVGVALGPVPLVERLSGAGGCRYGMRAPEEIVNALAMAYGPLAVDALTRCMSTFDAARPGAQRRRHRSGRPGHAAFALAGIGEGRIREARDIPRSMEGLQS